MRITSKGQVTIPMEIREKFGFLPDTEIEFKVEGNAVRIVKADARPEKSRGAALVRSLRGSASVRMTTDEIMALTRKP